LWENKGETTTPTTTTTRTATNLFPVEKNVFFHTQQVLNFVI